MSSERSEPAEGPGGDETPPSEPPGGTTKGLGDLTEEQRPMSRKAPMQKARPCLDGLTEELTLGIFQELDFRSLAAVKGVCHRLSRIAKDPSIFRRVTRVQWMTRGYHDIGWPWAQDSGSVFRTDCPQLGPIKIPEDGEGETAGPDKFLLALERLLEGGASPVSLQTPEFYDGGVLAHLPALLTKHEVRLEALACNSDHPAFPELLRTQPGLANLCIWDEERDLAPLLPSLRHLSYVGGSPWESGWLQKLVPQIRSLVLHKPDYPELLDVMGSLAEVEGGGLLFRAVGDVSCNQVFHASHVALAVEDFSAEERGAAFLKDGRPADPWDQAEHHIPQPTRDMDIIKLFLIAEVKRQRKSRQRKSRQ